MSFWTITFLASSMTSGSFWRPRASASFASSSKRTSPSTYSFRCSSVWKRARANGLIPSMRSFSSSAVIESPWKVATGVPVPA